MESSVPGGTAFSASMRHPFGEKIPYKPSTVDLFIQKGDRSQNGNAAIGAEAESGGFNIERSLSD